MGPLSADQKAQVLGTVQALSAQSRELDVLRQKQGLYLDALGDMKGIVEDATSAFTRGDLGEIIRSPGKLLASFQQLNGKLLFEKLIGDTFRQLEDHVTGRDKVSAASDVMAGAVGRVSTQIDVTTGAMAKLGRAAESTAGALASRPGVDTGNSAPIAGVSTGIPAIDGVAGTLLGAISGLAGRGGSAVDTGGDIVVTGRRQATPAITGDLSLPAIVQSQIQLPAAIDRALGKHDQSAQQFYTAGLGKVGEQIGHILGVKDPKEFGAAVGKYAGGALAGAATGQFVSGIANTLGVHLSQTGSTVGGAIGGALGSIIPGGSIIGSIAGGLLGDLFAPKAHPGGATVSAVNGEAAIAGSVGSDKAGIAAGSSLGGQVASDINQIVQQLGGTLGTFSVQIGKYKDDLRVNVNGRPLGGVTGSGATGFGTDENAAVNFAVQQAISQGAITGIDDKVAAALRSSTSIDTALKEALKVQNLETWINGVTGTINKAFGDFDEQAKERVRIAQQYGFDVLAIEKRNADDRVALAANLAKQQVGPLQQLIDEMTSGSLFEGSALDKITALNESIEKAKADLDAGVDGAADTLSGLYQQRLSASKDAFGTTGQYAADRNATLDEARAQIAKVNAQITAAQAGTSTAAQQATTDAVKAVGALTDESNDLLATVNGKLDQLIAATAGSSKLIFPPDYSLTQRQVS